MIHNEPVRRSCSTCADKEACEMGARNIVLEGAGIGVFFCSRWKDPKPRRVRELTALYKEDFDE